MFSLSRVAVVSLSICLNLSAGSPLSGAVTEVGAADNFISLAKRDDFFPARVPYVLPLPGTDPIADAIRARRENGTLLALDGVLLNTPLVAQTWNSLFGVIRGNTSLPGNMRELVILRIATLNNAAYEWLQHEPVGRAEGLTTPQLQAIRLTPSLVPPSGKSHEGQQPQLAKTLGAQLAAALEFTDWSTQAVRVPNDVFESTRQALGNNNQQIVELAATCGAYNFVSRFLVSLDIDGKDSVTVPIPK